MTSGCVLPPLCPWEPSDPLCFRSKNGWVEPVLGHHGAAGDELASPPYLTMRTGKCSRGFPWPGLRIGVCANLHEQAVWTYTVGCY